MNFACVNGQLVPADHASIGIQDMAVQRAYGMFDFFKIMKGKPIFLDDHLNRFLASADAMRLPMPVSNSELTEMVSQLIEKNQWVQAGVRISLTAGYAPDGYSIHLPNWWMTGQPLQLPDEMAETGLRLISFEHIRQLPYIKTIDYLMAVWLQERIKAANAHEVLYHVNGWISECPRANFFIVTESGELVTPATGALAGITRRKILEIAGSIMKVVERPVHLNELKTAREAFITSTTKYLHPVTQVDEIRIGSGRPGRFSRELFNAYLQLLTQ